MGSLEHIAVHFPLGGVVVSRDGSVVTRPSVNVPPDQIRGANGAGDALSPPVFCTGCTRPGARNGPWFWRTPPQRLPCGTFRPARRSNGSPAVSHSPSGGAGVSAWNDGYDICETITTKGNSLENPLALPATRTEGATLMGLGTQIRLRRIFSHPSGRLFGAAVDHFIGYGNVRTGGLADLGGALREVMAARPNSVHDQCRCRPDWSGQSTRAHRPSLFKGARSPRTTAWQN